MENTVEMWCNDCKEVVEVTPKEDYITVDGKRHLIDIILECPHGDTHSLDEIAYCPICHNPMGEYDDFCPECYAEGVQALTELKEHLGATQADFEDLIANCMGW